MTIPLVISIDAMGGDDAPEKVIDGLAIASAKAPDVRFLVYGRPADIEPLLARHSQLKETVDFRPTDKVILPDDKAGQALRRGRDSSMGLAIQAVKDGEAGVAVSAGNTGALMALAKFMLRTMLGIDRPAIAGLIPTEGDDSVMLDLGANVECSAENLVQNAVMGAAYARTVLNKDRPSVGLLNIGTEELKGHGIIKLASQILKDAPLPIEFAGNVEGDRISKGEVDVIVADGFTGNIALKSVEGTAKFVGGLFKEVFERSIWGNLAFLIVRHRMARLQEHLDPNNHNGGVFLGLNGLVVKSHGGANAKGFANAIDVAIHMARNDLSHLIAEDLKNFEGHGEEIHIAARA